MQPSFRLQVRVTGSGFMPMVMVMGMVAALCHKPVPFDAEGMNVQGCNCNTIYI